MVKRGGAGENKSGEVERLVRRYYTLLHALDPDTRALDAILGEKLAQIDHPNAVSPRGLTRGKRQLLADQGGGGDVLADQSFDVRDVLVSGPRAAVRGVWSGTLRHHAGRLPAGTRLVAHVAAFLTVQDGLIVEHETFECYEPIGAGSP